jgi:hypothetical protein
LAVLPRAVVKRRPAADQPLQDATVYPDMNIGANRDSLLKAGSDFERAHQNGGSVGDGVGTWRARSKTC